MARIYLARISRVRDANLEGANLGSARGVRQAQVDSAMGDITTELPTGIVMPASWTQQASSWHNAQTGEAEFGRYLEWARAPTGKNRCRSTVARNVDCRTDRGGEFPELPRCSSSPKTSRNSLSRTPHPQPARKALLRQGSISFPMVWRSTGTRGFHKGKRPRRIIHQTKPPTPASAIKTIASGIRGGGMAAQL